MTAHISLENVNFYRGNQHILKDLSFSITKPGIVGLLGKNGAGKSTTISLLMGYLTPQSGRCTILGEPSDHLSEATRQKVGILHEGFTQYDFMTISEIENFYRRVHAQTWSRDAFWDLIDRMHLEPTRRLTQLSHGQRSQVTLGVLLAQRPEVLILDDYSLGLDVGYRRLFLTYLKDYVHHFPVTVLLTSHIVSELEHILDEVLILKQGKLMGQWCTQCFIDAWHTFELPLDRHSQAICERVGTLVNFEVGLDTITLTTSQTQDELIESLKGVGASSAILEKLQPKKMSFVDTFVSITGLY